MNLHILKLTFVTLIILVTTGCSITDDTGVIQANSKPSNLIENQVLKTAYSNKKQASNQKSKDFIRILEQTISYKVNVEQKEKTAFLTYNDNQNYSMYVLPEYKLIVEEPHKDMVYFSNDYTIFMRIEILPDNINWKKIKKSTISELNLVSTENFTKTSLEGKFLEKSEVYEANNNTDVVTIYFLNKEDIKLKLTMYTKIDADHRDAFFQMAQTIMKEAPK